MTDSKHSVLLETSINAAKAGAKIGMKYFNTHFEVKLKEDATILTKADIESEEAIKLFILKQFPDAHFVAEESGGDMDVDSFWIVDPIDGTRSFSRGISTWCVLIAYYEKGQVITGACYFPVLDYLLYAEKGKGAYFNGKRVHVSDIKEMKVSLGAFGSLRHMTNKNTIYRLTEKCGATRGYDTSYSALLVACGSVDILVDEYSNLWDAGPFLVIIPEAGGKITNLKGEDWTPHDRGYIISNNNFHDEVVRIVNGK